MMSSNKYVSAWSGGGNIMDEIGKIIYCGKQYCRRIGSLKPGTNCLIIFWNFLWSLSCQFRAVPGLSRSGKKRRHFHMKAPDAGKWRHTLFSWKICPVMGVFRMLTCHTSTEWRSLNSWTAIPEWDFLAYHWWWIIDMEYIAIKSFWWGEGVFPRWRSFFLELLIDGGFRMRRCF